MRPSRRTTAMRTATIIVGAMLAVAGVGACTSSGGSGGKSADRAAFAAPTKASAAAAGAGGSSAKGEGATSDTGLELSSAKIRTAQLEVAVQHNESVAAKANAATAIVLATGGEVDSDDRSSGRYPTATMVLRVPPEDLTAVLGQLARLGTETSRQVSTKDVTSKVADVDSRVASARGAIVRLRDLYQHAVKVGDIISIESELSSRESDLESLQAQQRALAAETSLATITLGLTRAATKVVAPPAKSHGHRTGFLGGLQDGWDAFSRGAAGVATAAGAILPFAVLLLVLGFLARLVWPRLRPRRPPAPTPDGAN
jgi:hypothetical protein